MPNWVYNNLSVEGSEKDVKVFMEKARQPYETSHLEQFGENTGKVKKDITEGEILFWNFKQPEDKEAYFAASDYKPEGYEEMSTQEKMAFSMQFKTAGWYDWNVREWGTKWEISGSKKKEESFTDGKGVVQYHFETAWSPANEVFEAMVEQHPELTFNFYCEEEQGWGVEFSGEDGQMGVVKEWGIPESHTDYVNLDRVLACVCANEEDSTEWFEDCPNTPTQVAEAVQAIDDISELIG
jgi:hypothetical protein